jgi:hypothetical protein
MELEDQAQLSVLLFTSCGLGTTFLVLDFFTCKMELVTGNKIVHVKMLDRLQHALRICLPCWIIQRTVAYSSYIVLAKSEDTYLECVLIPIHS